MPSSPDAFPQRRPTKLPDALSLASAKDPSLTRMHQPFKGIPEPHHRSRTLLFFYFKYILLGLLLIAALCASLIYSSSALLLSANYLGRQCFYENPGRGVDLNDSIAASPYRFAMVTCTDGGDRIPGRSFEGLMDFVIPNKMSYVQRHGYEIIDASDVLDAARPPSWSKILAVRKHLPNFDWVFWNDVDSLVTNPEISLDVIIKSVVGNRGHSDMPDLIITKDVTGVNAGMFFFRNTEWSMQFLDLWWNQTSFIRPFGQMKSGDNDALKYLIQAMPEEEFKQHVIIPQMQCAFNSYFWSPSLKNGHRLMALPKTVWQGVYSKGDFMVHLAGLNDKKAWIQRILQELQEDDITPQSLSRKEGYRLRNNA